MNSFNVLRYAIQILCHGGAIWWCFALAFRYFKNEDASKIQYKKFHTHPNDLYPTLTLCLNSETGGLFINKNVVPNSKSLFQVLIGDTMPTSPEIKPYQNSIEAMIPNMTYFLKKFYAKNEYSQKIDPWYHPDIYPNGYKTFKRFKNADLKFYTSYVDPTTICYSWDFKFSLNELLRNADVYIQTEKLKQIEGGNAYVLLHSKGELIRNLHRYLQNIKTAAITGKDNHLTFEIIQITKMKYRPGGAIPCDPNSINDDSKWFRKVTDEVGCIPGYWGELIAKDQPGTINGNRFCNSTSQYSKLKSFFPLDHCGAQGNAKNVLKHFDPFCHQLRVMTTTKPSDWKEPNILKLQFRYIENEFEEIQNIQEFTVDSLYGNMGGYIGIFVGYSLVQISDVIQVIMKWILKTCPRGRVSSVV